MTNCALQPSPPFVSHNTDYFTGTWRSVADENSPDAFNVLLSLRM